MFFYNSEYFLMISSKMQGVHEKNKMYEKMHEKNKMHKVHELKFMLVNATREYLTIWVSVFLWTLLLCFWLLLLFLKADWDQGA